MSARDQRPPPCHRCGIVESAFATDGRHTCNPTSIQMMQIGADAVGRIGTALRDAFAVFSR